MIELKDVHKSFGTNEVLKGINLEICSGDVVVILGASGSGKTTLLRCINFLDKADSGTLIIDEDIIDLKHASKKEILFTRRKSAFVFQNHNLFNNKTALENVMEGLIVARKISRKVAEEKAKDALNKVGLTEKYNSYPSQLSGGQQQRVGIARAIVLNPEFIMFDEPTSALDPELVGETLKIMKNIADEGVTMIVVTHEMTFASQVANKVVFMNEGVIVEEGSPKEIFLNPREETTKRFLNRILPPSV